MPLVAITRLRVRSWRYLPLFFAQTLRAAIRAKGAEGNLAVSVMRDAHKTYWTRTVWSNDQAMRAFLWSHRHRQLLRRLAEWCDEAAVVHWTQESPEAPSWETAHERMLLDGQPARVTHPSETQRAYQIPPPWVRRMGVLQFK